MSRLAGALLALALAAPGGELCAESVSDGRYAMGTVLELRIEHADADHARAVLERLYARVAELERIFSRHDPESALSRLNAAAGSSSVAVPEELVALMGGALTYTRLTRGAFDPTVGPLVALWWQAAGRDRAPDASELAEARARVGPSRVSLDPLSGRARLAAGSALDLGAIAKGYTADVLVRELARAGVDSALLSFGQSTSHALGAPPGEDGWRLALRGPDGGVAGVVTLRDDALSVSASLGQSLAIRGHRYGHVIDPATGEPLRGARVVAVVARAGERADALSTALLVLGPGGLPVLESFGDAEGLLLERDVKLETAGWRERTRWVAARP